MLRNEFEEILITETPYYQRMNKIYRDSINFKRYLEVLKKVSNNDPVLKYFDDKEGREIVFLGRKIFALQEEFVANYLKFLKDESLISKWDEFFERYSNTIFDIYKRFTQLDPFKIFIFEIVNRKLLRDILTKEIASRGVEEKVYISERIGMVVNQLFNYIRRSLTRNVMVQDRLISDSYERIPLYPKTTRAELTKLLAKPIFKKGLPEPLFSGILKNLMNTSYNEGLQRIVDEIKMLGKAFSREKIMELLNARFVFPDENGMLKVMTAIQSTAQGVYEETKKKIMVIEKQIEELEQRMEQISKELSNDLMNEVRNFSTEDALEVHIKKLKRNLISLGYDIRRFRIELQEYQKQEGEIEGLLKLKITDFAKFIAKNEWDPYLLFLVGERNTIEDETLQNLIKEVASEVKGNKEYTNLLNEFRITGFLRESYNTTEIMKRFDIIIKEIFEPFLKTLLLEELIDYYPKVGGALSMENIRFVAEEALQGKVSVVEKEIKTVPLIDVKPKLNVSRYKNLVTVLTYDIRGSTFMGTKLQNAEKENEIRNLFQETMLTVIEKFGGLPIKDTGDGGIILFANNNFDIKNQKTKIPVPGSVLNAVRCGLEMVKESINFVQENIEHYKDWFKEAEDRKIDFEGVTYATLPPVYQSIFQIGVGIASGEYPKEVYLDRNAFGELDLTGMLVRESNFYSKIKSREKSTVICDDATIFNLLLNVDKFSFLSDTGVKLTAESMDIEQELEFWINQKISRRGFILDLYRIFISKMGEEIYHPGSLKILLGVSDIAIEETGEIKDGKGGRGKFLFELSYEVPK
uniref:Guanylate cyclase domain-containing protein n=1 Tax=candidate division WOR-3 bacterium TaxID=2052148 RepID=A0A7C6EIL1_UNCW3